MRGNSAGVALTLCLLLLTARLDGAIGIIALAIGVPVLAPVTFGLWCCCVCGVCGCVGSLIDGGDEARPRARARAAVPSYTRLEEEEEEEQEVIAASATHAPDLEAATPAALRRGAYTAAELRAREAKAKDLWADFDHAERARHKSPRR